MARSADPMSYAAVVTYVYCRAIPGGVLRPDDSAVREIEDALADCRTIRVMTSRWPSPG